MYGGELALAASLYSGMASVSEQKNYANRGYMHPKIPQRFFKNGSHFVGKMKLNKSLLCM